MTTSLPCSPLFFPLRFFTAFVVILLEVSPVHLTFDEVLSIVLYDLSRLDLQLHSFGFIAMPSTAPFTFAAILLMLVADFVVVLSFSFLKARSTFL
jgi:hypothetical protein